MFEGQYLGICDRSTPNVDFLHNLMISMSSADASYSNELSAPGFPVALECEDRARKEVVEQRAVKVVERLLQLVIDFASRRDVQHHSRGVWIAQSNDQSFTGWTFGSAHIGVMQSRQPLLSIVADFRYCTQASGRLLARTIVTRATSSSGSAWRRAPVKAPEALSAETCPTCQPAP